MKRRSKWIALLFVSPIVLFLGYIVISMGYGCKYAHQHCIKQAGMSFRLYANDHEGRFPSSTNGFGNALLLLMDPDNLYMSGAISGPGDDGHLYREAFTNKSIMPENLCSRIYVQGLSETNDPQICILFDRNSCRGGDHFRSPWPWHRRVREVCLLDGSMQVIADDRWTEFSRNQVELLTATGFSRDRALRFYPAAR